MRAAFRAGQPTGASRMVATRIRHLRRHPGHHHQRRTPPKGCRVAVTDSATVRWRGRRPSVHRTVQSITTSTLPQSDCCASKRPPVIQSTPPANGGSPRTGTDDSACRLRSLCIRSGPQGFDGRGRERRGPQHAEVLDGRYQHDRCACGGGSRGRTAPRVGRIAAAPERVFRALTSDEITARWVSRQDSALQHT